MENNYLVKYRYKLNNKINKTNNNKYTIRNKYNSSKNRTNKM